MWVCIWVWMPKDYSFIALNCYSATSQIDVRMVSISHRECQCSIMLSMILFMHKIDCNKKWTRFSFSTNENHTLVTTIQKSHFEPNILFLKWSNCIMLNFQHKYYDLVSETAKKTELNQSITRFDRIKMTTWQNTRIKRKIRTEFYSLIVNGY